MTSALAYEIGALFLVAALLMYGTMSGFVPRSLGVGKALPILLGVAVLAFAIYRFGPDLYAGWSSIGAVAPNLTTSRPAPAAPMPAPRATKSAAPRASAMKQPEANWKTIVIDDSVPAPAAIPVGKLSEGTVAKPARESSGRSPYDSGAKRAIKSIGHVLHIGRSKEKAPQ